MPVAVERIGVHIPRYRLGGDGGGAGLQGAERAVANWDEDSLTMAVAAAARCLGDVDYTCIGSLLVASTTFPYGERQGAAVVAEALDLPPSVETWDVSSSTRGGTQAIRLAEALVASGRGPVLVIATDVRESRVDDREFRRRGDAAVAVLLGAEGRVRLSHVYSEAMTAHLAWRMARDRFVRTADTRFAAQRLLDAAASAMTAAAREAAQRGWQIDAAAVGVPDGRVAVRAAGATVGLDRSAVYGPGLQQRIGYTGAAACLLALAHALRGRSGPSHLVMVDWGDGASSFLVEVDGDSAPGHDLEDQVAAGRPLAEEQMLRLRRLVEIDEPDPYSSPAGQWREHEFTSRLHGQECANCDEWSYPPRPTCPNCLGNTFRIVPVPKRGTLLTFTVDHLYPSPESEFPVGVLDLGRGRRFYCPLTDIDGASLRIGMPLELAFRRLHDGGGFRTYFWKAVARSRG